MSIQWQRAEDVIESDSQSVDLRPEIFTLQYGYQLSDSMSISLSAWKGADDRSITDAAFLEQDSSGYSLLVGHQFSPEFSWDYGLSIGQENAAISRTNTKHYFERDDETFEFFTGLNYSFSAGFFDISPSIGLGHQKNEQYTQLELPQGSTNTSKIFSGSYISTALNLSYFFEGRSHILWIPSISLNWIETLTGDLTNTTNFKNKSVALTRSNEGEENASGSGSLTAALFIIVEDYYANVFFNQSIGAGDSLSDVGFQVGLDF